MGTIAVRSDRQAVRSPLGRRYPQRSEQLRLHADQARSWLPRFRA